MVLAPKRNVQDDNVESVDMEMSSEEEAETDIMVKSGVSFSLAPQNKTLVESPLKEKEEPKVKKLVTINFSPPSRLPEPPPLPNVDEIFPELDSGEESEEMPETIPSPPRPPPPPPMPIQPIQPIQTIHEVQVLNPGFSPNQRPRGYFNPRFNNHRQRFPSWQNNMNNNNNNNMRQRQPLLANPRFRPDTNFRGRPPWFRGNRPPRFAGCFRYSSGEEKSKYRDFI